MASSERDERRRGAFREYVRSIVSERFVFVDECSTNISLSPIYGRAPRGERARGKAPRNWGKNVTLLSSLSAKGMAPSVAVEGATTRAVFEAYLKEALCPSFSPGQVVVMDNLSAHKGEKVRELVEGRRWELLYLPPYSSPDLNPIEQAFAKLKALLRSAGARTRETLIGAMGEALSAVTTQDASGFFRHCGYQAPAQLL